MIEQPENQSMFQPIGNNIVNQEIAQANDPELYPTMKKVIDFSKQKPQFDEKKGEEEKIGEEKDSLVKSGSVSAKRKIDYNRLNLEFKDIFNKENSNINKIRRNLIHIIIVASVINCIVWELDCLFLNACYGEDIEMEQTVSALLFPIIIISIIVLYLLYVTINYLREIPIKICIIFYAIISVIFIILGGYSIIKGFKDEYNATEVVKNRLTKNEIEYYKELIYFNKYNNAEQNLKWVYGYKMIFTGFLNLALGLLGIIVVISSIVFNSLLAQTTFDWRPPLRSHIRMSRIKRAIELYTQNSESFINVFRAENPHYQMDEFDNKDKNRFGAVKGSVGDSFDLSKDKKSISQNNIINNINNNNEEEIILPKALPRKLNKIGDKKPQSDENKINTNIHNLINNSSNPENENEKENEINTNTNNLINNNINLDNENEKENEINTHLDKENNKEEI